MTLNLSGKRPMCWFPEQRSVYPLPHKVMGKQDGIIHTKHLTAFPWRLPSSAFLEPTPSFLEEESTMPSPHHSAFGCSDQVDSRVF